MGFSTHIVMQFGCLQHLYISSMALVQFANITNVRIEFCSSAILPTFFTLAMLDFFFDIPIRSIHDLPFKNIAVVFPVKLQ